MHRLALYGRRSGFLWVLFSGLWSAPAAAQATASFPENEERGAVPARSSPAPPPAQTPPPPAPPPPSGAAPEAGVTADAPAEPPPSASAPAPRTASSAELPNPSPPTAAPATPPPRLPYVEGDPVPPGYRVDERYPRGLVTVSYILLGAGYVTALALSTSDDAGPSSGWLYVPVLGPVGAIATRDASCPNMATDPILTAGQACADVAVSEARFVSLALLSGLLQLTGATLFVVGISDVERSLVLHDSARLSPTLSSSHAGLDFTTTF